MKYFDEIEKSARERNIPVMEKEGLEFLIQTFNEHQCHRCLEIGSAIGYSAMMMVSNIDDFVVETIELDDARYLEAIQNIKEQQLEDQIEIHHDDALTFDINDLKYQEFDCLFIDAAKAQYQKFFEKYMPLVQKNGICIVDNLDFHGMIFDIDHIVSELSKGMSLQAGTIIATGTPAGVGMGFVPPKFLKAGDVVECRIEGIGSIQNRVEE